MKVYAWIFTAAALIGGGATGTFAQNSTTDTRYMTALHARYQRSLALAALGAERAAIPTCRHSPKPGSPN